MNCKCKSKMKFIACDDNPDKDFAYNVYHCNNCAMLAKEDVWENAGVTWLYSDGIIVFEVKVDEI